MSDFERIGIELARFVRGEYCLDEVAGKHYSADCLRFRQGKKSIFTLILHEDHYEVLVVFGKAEREKFEANREAFSNSVLELYDSQPTYHDGKWLLLRVDNLEILEEAKKLIRLKKKPNRKLLPTRGAVVGKCGHRCDLCVHYKKLDDQHRREMEPHLTYVYGVDDWSMRCGGCGESDCYCAENLCDQVKCAQSRNLPRCMDCPEYPCPDATVGYEKLEARNISAEDVTLAISPYLPFRTKE